jgi:hypothetical protein
MERVTATQPLRVAHVDVSTVPVAAIPTADVSNWPAPDPFEGSSFVADEMGPQDVLLDAAAADAAPVGTDPVAEPVPVEWRQVGPPSITAGDVIANARSLLGVPYLWGGNTTAGMDCSAYVSRAWGVPRQTTDTLYLVAYPIAKEELLPGDVMNLTKSQDPRGYGHVRMFAAWANTDHSRVWVYEETPRQSIYHVIAYDSHYTPMRRENIVFDGQAAPLVPEPVSTPSAGTGSRPQPSATRTPTVTSSRVPGNVTPTTRATPSRTVTPTPTLGATLTPSATRTPLATRTPVPSAPTATPRSAPTLTPTATPKAYRPSPTPTPWKQAPRN